MTNVTEHPMNHIRPKWQRDLINGPLKFHIIGLAERCKVQSPDIPEADFASTFVCAVHDHIDANPEYWRDCLLPAVPEQFRAILDAGTAVDMWQWALIMASHELSPGKAEQAITQACESMGIEFVKPEDWTPVT